jgi:hypothetical protein
MLPPELPTADPAYSALFAEGAFGQRPTINASKLREEAERRRWSLPLFPASDVLEPLDLLSAFSPIGFLQANYDVETTWLEPDPQVMVWREEHNPRPLRSHAWRADASGQLYVSERYTEWQMLYLGDVLAAGRWEPPIANVVNPRLGLGAPPSDLWTRRVAGVRNLDEAWRLTVKLLVALQARFWAYRRQRVTYLHTGRGGPAVDQLEVVAERFDPFQVLRRFELGLSELATLHGTFVDEARRLDPVAHLNELLEMAPRARTDLMRGEALRARDHYDAAFLLRMLYWSATKRWLPLGPEIESARRSADEYRRRYLPRSREREPDDRSRLKELLIAERLYPHMLHVFVEGDTEEIVVGGLLKLFARSRGTIVTNLRGVDQAERYRALFSAATEYAARTVLIADREGSLTRVLRRLRDTGILTGEDDVLLWENNGEPSSFEEANFTYGELLRAIRAAARRRNATLSLTAPELRRAYREAVRRSRAERTPRPALATFALKLANLPEHGHVRVSKRELAPELLAILTRVLDRAGTLYAARQGRPLLARLWTWLAR